MPHLVLQVFPHSDHTVALQGPLSCLRDVENSALGFRANLSIHRWPASPEGGTGLPQKMLVWT